MDAADGTVVAPTAVAQFGPGGPLDSDGMTTVARSPLRGGVRRRAASARGDRVFLALARAMALLALGVSVAIGVFLAWESVSSLQADSTNFFTTEQWLPDGSPPSFGIAALAFGTLMTSAVALLLAVPIAIGVALFVSEYAPRVIGAPLAFVVDLLAAVPSIVFGLWGLAVLMPQLQGVCQWLAHYLGWIPLFADDEGIFTRSVFIAGVVLAIMILPTISAVCREVFLQLPAGDREAALALGATRWESVRMVVLPAARPGMISAAMLGLGRALGETIAVALVLSAVVDVNWHILEPGGSTFAANIALKFNEAGSIGVSALIASGLVLFVITLAVNAGARTVVRRYRQRLGHRA